MLLGLDLSHLQGLLLLLLHADLLRHLDSR